MRLLGELALEQAHLLSSGAQFLGEHGTERDGPDARLCRAHDRNVLPCGAPLTEPAGRAGRPSCLSVLDCASAGALEVDAEGIATPAAHWQLYPVTVPLHSSTRAS